MTKMNLMIMKNSIHSRAFRFAPAVLSGILAMVSCSEAIDVHTDIDDSRLGGLAGVSAILNIADAPRTGIIEMRLEPVELQAQISLTGKYSSIADFSVTVDGGLAAEYNGEHGTDFKAFPAECISMEDEGNILVAPGDVKSYDFSITLTPDDNVTAGETYILPLVLSSKNTDISVGGTKYLLIKALGEIPSTAKASGIKTICYVEVNGFNPLNALTWKLATSGTQLIDIVNIFSANIKFNSETGRAYLSLNPNVKHILDNRDKYIKPLQDAGMKVCLTILPDHDGVGVSNLTDEDIRLFVAELKAVVEAYGLDGIDYDDEYAEYTTHSIPGFPEASSERYSKLCYETKMAMPDKLCTVYFIGSITAGGFMSDIDGLEPGDYVDYSYYAQYGSWSSAYTFIKGMEKKQWGPYSVDMNNASLYMFDNVRNEGYGIQVIYDLRAENDPNVVPGSYKTTLNTIATKLYDENIMHTGVNYTKDW